MNFCTNYDLPYFYWATGSENSFNYNQGTTASYMRFSDIWADEWKSKLHIAIQLQSRLTGSQMNFWK